MLSRNRYYIGTVLLDSKILAIVLVPEIRGGTNIYEESFLRMDQITTYIYIQLGQHPPDLNTGIIPCSNIHLNFH